MSVASQLIATYSGRTVLVTGGAGFTGIWLATMLDQLGAKVTTLGLELTRRDCPVGTNGLELPQSLKARHIDCDIRNLPDLKKHIADVGPQIVLHLAAQPLVLNAFDNPYETMSSNATGTLNVLEACTLTRLIETVLIVTTDKVYRNEDDGRAMRENDPLCGSDPYSSSKVAAEAITLGYAQALRGSGPRIGIARAGNIIGGGDWSADRLVPDFMRSVVAKKSLSVRNKSATRPWQHVLDAAAGYLIFTSAIGDPSGSLGAKVCPALNLGPPIEDCLSVGEIIEILSELSGSVAPDSGLGVNTVAQGREKQLLQLDTTMSERELGWVPKLRIGAALGLTWDIYDLLIRQGDAQRAMQNQIHSYLAKLEAK